MLYKFHIAMWFSSVIPVSLLSYNKDPFPLKNDNNPPPKKNPNWIGLVTGRNKKNQSREILKFETFLLDTICQDTKISSW